jgi:hypothetical protein
VSHEFLELARQYFGCEETSVNTTRILLVNVEGRDTYSQIKSLINTYEPHLCWIMECRKTLEFPGYYSIISHVFHKNHLLVRQDLMSKRSISRIPYGLQVDEYCFRYVPPGAKERCEFTRNEFGDFNYRSNVWINMNNFIAESRKGKPGGLGYSTEKRNKRKFVSFPSDHDACFIEIEGAMTSKKQVDCAKVKMAINDAVNKIENMDLYKRWSKKNVSNKLIKFKESKVVNPIARKLKTEPWDELYQHDEHKLPNQNHLCKCAERESKTITSKALDVNDIPIRSFIEICKPLNLDQINLVLRGFRWIQFNSRTICLKKKDKEPNTVKNLRPIQISPVTFKIAEQSRTRLKQWLELKTSPKCFAFRPKTKISKIVKVIKNWIINSK